MRTWNAWGITWWRWGITRGNGWDCVPLTILDPRLRGEDGDTEKTSVIPAQAGIQSCGTLRILAPYLFQHRLRRR
ncbi:hypothetical protein GCM10017655_24090 [Pseudomonas turukhanskensis]|uniref:Uncharacterized protein n=1 Tax=Pseudomonas turukhanskensis TaxID=1806536 RepID=A0A9W6K5Q0_9PSED|nr:hypothetical protein GCM10017655_24090 [Pseudomonas turukhanskensis]